MLLTTILACMKPRHDLIDLDLSYPLDEKFLMERRTTSILYAKQDKSET